MYVKTYPDHYKDRNESMRLVKTINRYWSNRGYPHFAAYIEEQLVEHPNGRKERTFVVRSNIKQRCVP